MWVLIVAIIVIAAMVIPVTAIFIERKQYKSAALMLLSVAIAPLFTAVAAAASIFYPDNYGYGYGYANLPYSGGLPVFIATTGICWLGFYGYSIYLLVKKKGYFDP